MVIQEQRTLDLLSRKLSLYILYLYVKAEAVNFTVKEIVYFIPNLLLN